MSLMLPAAWLSLNPNSRSLKKRGKKKKEPSTAIGSPVFHLDSYCTAKENVKQAPTITAISQTPC